MSGDALFRDQPAASAEWQTGAGDDLATGHRPALNLRYFATAAYRALTASKHGPSLFEFCDPLLRGSGAGNAHLRKFYRKALGNIPLRIALARAGQPLLAYPGRFAALRDAVVAARDQQAPDWRAIGRPLAELVDQIGNRHPRPRRSVAQHMPVTRAQIDHIIRVCANQLIAAYAKQGFIPCYAAFNLIGDPDFHGSDLVVALDGLNARTYKNSTFLFNLARVFIANTQAEALINPPWTGIAEPMWEPVQIRHRSAYYDAFYAEALMDFLGTGLATAEEEAAAKKTTGQLIEYCLHVSREQARVPGDERRFEVITALVPPPHSRLSAYFNRLKSDLGFGIYLADCDTTACAFSAAAQSSSSDPILDQTMIDFYAAHQVGTGIDKDAVSVPLNDNIDFDGGIVTWIENLAGERPFGNDLDPTLNLDVLEAAFRNFDRWHIAESPRRIEVLRRIVNFQRRLAETRAFADPRSHIYYLPELYCAYFGRCYAALRALPPATQRLVDPDNSFELIRREVLSYVVDELLAVEMNPFDAALALLALAKLKANPRNFTAPLACLVSQFGEGRWGTPYKAYEWNKMKTPTRIVVGGPEATSAFVLSALAHARRFVDA